MLKCTVLVFNDWNLLICRKQWFSTIRGKGN